MRRRRAASSTRNHAARILAGQDHLAFEPRGEACADLVFGHARIDGQDRAGIVRGLQQARQDAELPDAKARGTLLMFYPAAEPWRGGDPGTGLGVELAEPSLTARECPVAHPGEQLRRGTLAVLDAGYLAGVIADPLPELGEGPLGRAPCPAYLPPEVPGGVARALAHRVAPLVWRTETGVGGALEVDAEGIAAPAAPTATLLLDV